MKEQFFELSQPDKDMYIKRSRLISVLILSNLCCILLGWCINTIFIEWQDNKEQAPVIGYVKNVLDENGRPILKSAVIRDSLLMHDETIDSSAFKDITYSKRKIKYIEVPEGFFEWGEKEQTEWMQNKEIEAWKDENEWLFGDKYDRRIEEGFKNGSVTRTEYERWKKSKARTDSGYPIPTDNQLYHALERLKDLEKSQLALQRRYDSLNKKFEQWKAEKLDISQSKGMVIFYQDTLGVWHNSYEKLNEQQWKAGK